MYNNDLDGKADKTQLPQRLSDSFTPTKTGNYLLCLAPIINSNSGGYLSWNMTKVIDSPDGSDYQFMNKQSGVYTTRASSPIFQIVSLVANETYYLECYSIAFSDLRMLQPENSWIMLIS